MVLACNEGGPPVCSVQCGGVVPSATESDERREGVLCTRCELLMSKCGSVQRRVAKSDM